MANATTLVAPKKDEIVEVEGQKLKMDSKEYLALTMQFDPGIKYMFELAEQNLERELPIIDVREKRPIPHQKFKPYQNIVLSSQIVWNGQRQIIRYYDGCDTLFVSQQPKDKDAIEQFIKQTRRREFLEGRFGAYGDERMLLLYMTICSWNALSEFRTRAANGIFIPMDKGKQALAESSKLDQTETALGYAKEASETKMLIHAHYLGIATTDYDSGNELTPKEIRIEYRKRALRDSANFIETYGNKNIETKYYIDKALEKGLVSSKFNPNKATWQKSNAVICDISGLKSNEAIAIKLFEFASSEEGEEFKIQLTALFN
jgi:hypothetical protein